MLDTTTNAAALLPQQVAASAHNRCQAPSGCRHPGPRWYVLASYPKAERTAHAALHLKGYEPYLPLITTRWRDRTWHTGPLFTGYLFVKLDLARPWYPIRWCPGVFHLISTDGIPTPCPEAAVDALRAGEAARSIPATPDSLYRPGAPCEAVLGGGSKVEAVVMAVDGHKARVLVLMFGQMREMAVDIGNLRLRGE